MKNLLSFLSKRIVVITVIILGILSVTLAIIIALGSRFTATNNNNEWVLSLILAVVAGLLTNIFSDFGWNYFRKLSKKETSMDDIDLSKLANELSLLRSELKRLAKEPEEDLVIGTIASAEIEARNGDKLATLGFLAKTNQSSLDVAIKLGKSIAAKAISASIQHDK
jgi:hypothetical protein